MGSLVSFRRKLDGLVLEEVRQQAERSWLSSQTMPTEVVDALVDKVDALQISLQILKAAFDHEVESRVCAELEVEGLRRQLEQAKAQVAAVAQAVEWLWGFWDGNSLRAIPGFEDDIRDAWDKLLEAIGEH